MDDLGFPFRPVHPCTHHLQIRVSENIFLLNYYCDMSAKLIIFCVFLQICRK